MQSIERRLLAIERQREAAKPPRPCLVVLPSEDLDAKLAEFRRVHGFEPERVITVRRAPAPPRP